ncbi:MAG: DNA helicase UvrD [Aquabacterium sp.]|nr:MAG: DNA helicase UvrD [Aquabacterium sp.]
MSAQGGPMPGPSYWIDGQLAGSERFYAVACDPRRSVVVEACAGAGKTWMLVSRILRALLDGCEPQEVLAITFTRKAAAEMRERLTQWLDAFTRAAPHQREAELLARGVAAADVSRAAEALGSLRARLLASGRAVSIHTFHGWFSQLLRAAPMDMLASLGLAPDLVLVEDIEDLLPDLWRAFHARVGADAQLRAAYVDWVGRLGRHAASAWLLAALGRRIEFELADAAGVVDASVPEVAEGWPEFAAWTHPAAACGDARFVESLRQLVRDWTGHKSVTAGKAAARLDAALMETDHARALALVREALLTKSNTVQARLPEHPCLDHAAGWLLRVIEAVDQHEARELHLSAARLTRVLLAEYAQLKRERGLADMADLELAALHLLRDASLAGWVQERLDARVRQVLIDEFQDTSPLQWQALQAWLAGYAGAGGGASGQQPPGVFIVGDPKQSIYRFRRAEPRVFIAAQRFVADGLGGSLLACDHTRRNAPGVLEALNSVFEQATQQGEFAGFRAHTTSRGTDPMPPPLRALPAISRVKAAREDAAGGQAWRDSLGVPRVAAEEALRLREGRQIAAAIQALLEQGLPAREIFVLARKREALRWAAEALRERRIPHVLPEARSLLDAAEARDLLALLDVLTSPHHDLALAQVLRSPLFAAGDDDLVALALRVRGRGQWWAALQDWAAEADDTLPQPLRRAAGLLRRWQQAADHLPPHDLLDRVLDEGRLRERLAAAVPPSQRNAALGHVDAVLALALRLDSGRYATPYGFLQALKRRALKLPATAAADAVQLLTVHGAKGLEAQAVFLADADAGPGKADTNTLLVDWPVEEGHPLRCAFLRSESRPPPALRAALQQEQEARQREELNALYVAMTRAKDLLVLSRCEPHRRGTAPSWWQRLLAAQVVAEERLWEPPAGIAPTVLPSAEAAEVPGLPEATHAGDAAPGPVGVTWDLPFDDEAGDEPDDLISRTGQAFHRLLQWLTALPPAEREAARPALLAQAGAEFGLPAERVDFVDAAAGRVLRREELAALLDPRRAEWAGNEVELSHRGQVLRLDRLVKLADGGWWVLDFKLDSRPDADPALRAQLRRYAEAVQAAVGERPRCAFVTARGELIEPG